eukprot:1160510-Pelagomonas_calceolata.AAC.7
MQVNWREWVHLRVRFAQASIIDAMTHRMHSTSQHSSVHALLQRLCFLDCALASYASTGRRLRSRNFLNSLYLTLHAWVDGWHISKRMCWSPQHLQDFEVVPLPATAVQRVANDINVLADRIIQQHRQQTTEDRIG